MRTQTEKHKLIIDTNTGDDVNFKNYLTPTADFFRYKLLQIKRRP